MEKVTDTGVLKGFCKIDNRIPSMVRYMRDHPGEPEPQCNATDLERLFCRQWNGTSTKSCDEYFVQAREKNLISKEPAIKGLASGVIAENAASKYLRSGQLISNNETDSGEAEGTSIYYVAADISTSFMILVGVFFPSVTGIMAGSNRSGDLKDASRSIPLGTITATSTASLVYLSGVLLFGASIHPMFLRDKFGESAYGRLAIAELAVLFPMVILVGCFLSTIGAGMQSLCGAPRLFQAIAKDGVIPMLAPFQVGTRFGEPLRAQLLTFVICELGILIAQLESLTALLSQFFLMCYLGVNAACCLQSLLGTPGWRPRFRYYHWSLSMFGSLLCLAVMFISHWGFALLAIAIGAIVYKYIEYRGAEKEWGDGIRGLGLSAARFALLRLEEGPVHSKNWRPQCLVLCHLLPSLEMRHPRMLSFASQLKAGKGLTVLATAIQGDYKEKTAEAQTIRAALKKVRDKYKIKGFNEVLVCKDEIDGLCSLIQTSGLGGLKHNTVMMSWPQNWNATEDQYKAQMFVETVRNTSIARCALIVLKNTQNFPDSDMKVHGTIDVWWIVHDGGLLMLIPFLLKQHKTWRHCTLRIFSVAQVEDNSLKMKEDLKTFLYHLRIAAEIEVVEMVKSVTHHSDISDYTYQRTLRLEQRCQMLRQLRLSQKERMKEVQSIVDYHHLKGDIDELAPGESAAAAPDAKANDDGEGKHGDNATNEENSDEKSAKIPLAVESNDLPAPNGAQRNEVDDKNGSKTAAVDSAEAENSAEAGNPAELDQYNVRRMHTAVKLNEAMRQRSSDAQLVIVNLPGPPKQGAELNYMDFIDALTEGLQRIVLVRGGGHEVITIFS